MKASTVFALSTAAGVAGIAVIRITGPAVRDALMAMTDRPVPPPRRATRRRLVDAEGKLLDDGLVLFFERPHSYTGEDMAELHCHGGRATIAAVLDRLRSIDGLSPAAPGEFTERAFAHGKLDLTQIEALGDLLAAETEIQRKQAVMAMGGGLRLRAEGWRSTLVSALALLEATIDWADEEVPEDVAPEVWALLQPLAAMLREATKGAAAAERVRTGFEVALVGAPNAGKSSLMNAIAGREAALATPVAGTTRDIIELRLDIAGLPVTLLDMAGLRESEDSVERMGVDRALARAAAADLRLLIEAPDAPLPPSAHTLMRKGDITISNKADIATGPHRAVSAVTGLGLDLLLKEVGAVFSSRLPPDGAVAHARQRAEIEAASKSVSMALASLGEVGTEITAEYLRSALSSLERLAGRTAPDDVLGEVFGRFCLGK